MKTTSCAFCGGPLTKDQLRRNRNYCSRRCAKLAWHRRNRGLGRQYLSIGHATNRRKYAERLKARLAGCRTLGDAYRLGYRLGYAVGANQRRRTDRKAA